MEKAGSSKDGDHQEKTSAQKAMLSRALQRAKTAVRLDNAQDFETAKQAYAEACEILQEVLQQTSGDENREKLEGILLRYSNRINDLDQIDGMEEADESAVSLALSRPLLDPSQPSSIYNRETFDADAAMLDTGEATRLVKHDRSTDTGESSRSYRVVRLANSNNEALQAGPSTFRSPYSAQPLPLRNAEFRTAPRPNSDDSYTSLSLSFSMAKISGYPKPNELENIHPTYKRDSSLAAKVQGHARKTSRESISWLDPINESCGSTGSSAHSRSSSMGILQKPIPATSEYTGIEFDAAFDAAVEAAYDDEFEPLESTELGGEESEEDFSVSSRPMLQLAKKRTAQSESGMIEAAFDKKTPHQRPSKISLKRARREKAGENFYDDNSSEEGERLLEQMARGSSIEDFTFRPQPLSGPLVGNNTRGLWQPNGLTVLAGPPPQSAPALQATALTKAPEPSPPAQVQAVLPTNGKALIGEPSVTIPPLKTVRGRRLSGQNAKQLMIDTFQNGRWTEKVPAREDEKAVKHRGIYSPLGADFARAATLTNTITRKSSLSPTLRSGRTDFTNPTSPEGSLIGHGLSPIASKPSLRKNFSSSSLRSLRGRKTSLSNHDDVPEMFSLASSGRLLGAPNRPLPAIPNLPSSKITDPLDSISEGTVGRPYLLDHSVHSPGTLSSPDKMVGAGPAPLEPCPSEHMLRPFWLMRCLYQTLVHPSGGYLSTRLFVPRDAWMVKGVKLRNLDDKVASCDFLTAALLKLAKVDNLDADAVLEEMQSFESVLDQVQANLTRRLGNEVGPQASGLLFKETLNAGEVDPALHPPKPASFNSKAPFSWKRLRSKTSSSLNATSKTHVFDGATDSVVFASLPMTANPTTRPPKRNVGQANFAGPYAHYMLSLASLFDVVQTIDQIARQVDDPGLRHADKTQVGLELSTRRAAEFFAFYICRFVLADLTTLLDKFIKRGSEWVLT